MKVFIADNEKKVRNAIRVLIEADGRFHICAEAANSQELFSYLHFSQPDILLLDSTLPGLKITPQTIQSIRLAVTGVNIILMSVDDNHKIAHLPADAMISKFCSAQDFLASIEQGSPRKQRQAVSSPSCMLG